MAAPPPPPPTNQDGYQQEEPAYDPIHAVGGPTQALGKLSEAVMIVTTKDNTFEKMQKLGQGGFGTVWLCKRTAAASRVRFVTPDALKDENPDGSAGQMVQHTL